MRRTPRLTLLSAFFAAALSASAVAGESKPTFDWQNAGFSGECLDFFPPETIVAIGTKNSAELLRLLRESALGKIAASAQLAPARKAFTALTAELPFKDAQPLVDWLNKFSGSAALGVWKVEPQKLLEAEAGAVLEITAPDPEAVYAEFLKLTGADQFIASQHDGLPMKVRLLGFAAVARAGKYLLLGTNKLALEKLAAALKAGKPAGLTASERCKKAAQNLPPATLQVIFSYTHYLELLQRMPDGDARYTKEVALGRDAYDLALYALSKHQDGFDEKYVTLYHAEEKTLPDDIDQQADRPLPLVPPPDPASQVPAQALMAAQFDLDGETVALFIDEYLPLAEDYISAQIERITRQPYTGEDFETVLLNFEALVGITIDELLKGVAGRHAVWLLPPAGLAAPDFGLSLNCSDAKAATKLAHDLEAVLKKALDDADAVVTETAGTHTLYTLDTMTFGERFKRVPYQLSWCAREGQLAAATSPAALKRYLESLDKKEPMLAANSLYLETFESRSAAEKDGQTLYIDLKTSLGLLQRFVLPVIGMMEPELVPLILELPPPEKIFGEFKPLVSYQVEEVEPARQIVTVRSPLPILPSLLAVVGIAIAAPSRPQVRPPQNTDK